MKPIQSVHSTTKRVSTVRITIYIVGALLLFLFAIELMTSSLQHLGKNISETIFVATANPFTALFIGLLVTAMLQSSSTTTALVVALVASGSITMHNAVPIIMGANVGTTITSTIVSLGFINKKKEFKRAVAAGTYHDFFNILTVLILFPLEYHYGFLSTLSQWVTGLFFTSHVQASERIAPDFWFGFNPLINLLIDAVPNAFLLCLLALALLFSSILIFRKLISDLLKAKSPEVFSRFFFKSPLKSFGWGLITTAAIRSSTITTSVVVPIVAKKIVKLREAAPFILGANVGTTVTAFIAALFYTNTLSAVSIAIIHFLFNFIGVLIFLPIPILRRIPIALANGMGRLTLKYRLAGFVYLLTTFFFIPFSLIYFHQDSTEALDLTYLQTNESNISTEYRVVSKINTRTQQGEWSKFEASDEVPSLIYPITVKNNTLFIGKQMFLFNKPGLCWGGGDEAGKFELCIDRIIPSIKISDMIFDSVYVYKMQYREPYDSIVHRYYVSAPLKIYLKHEIERPGDHTRVVEKLVRLETQ